MEIIFEITDKSGRKIHLSKERWKHIRRDHPDVEEEEIKLTLQKPIRIMDKRKNKHFYYQYFKYKKPPSKFLRVIMYLFSFLNLSDGINFLSFFDYRRTTSNG